MFERGKILQAYRKAATYLFSKYFTSNNSSNYSLNIETILILITKVVVTNEIKPYSCHMLRLKLVVLLGKEIVQNNFK